MYTMFKISNNETSIAKINTEVSYTFFVQLQFYTVTKYNVILL